MTRAARKRIVADIAAQNVIAKAAINRVIALARGHRIVARTCHNCVVQAVRAIHLIALRIGKARTDIVRARRAVHRACRIAQDRLDLAIRDCNAVARRIQIAGRARFRARWRDNHSRQTAQI